MVSDYKGYEIRFAVNGQNTTTEIVYAVSQYDAVKIIEARYSGQKFLYRPQYTGTFRKSENQLKIEQEYVNKKKDDENRKKEYENKKNEEKFRIEMGEKQRITEERLKKLEIYNLNTNYQLERDKILPTILVCENKIDEFNSYKKNTENLINEFIDSARNTIQEYDEYQKKIQEEVDYVNKIINIHNSKQEIYRENKIQKQLNFETKLNTKIDLRIESENRTNLKDILFSLLLMYLFIILIVYGIDYFFNTNILDTVLYPITYFLNFLYK